MRKKFCPRCKGSELNFLPWIGQIWECRRCGWRSPLIVEEDDQ